MSLVEGLLIASALFNIGAVLVLIRSDRRDIRKEKLIARLNEKVLEYRQAVQHINMLLRTEKADDDLV